MMSYLYKQIRRTPWLGRFALKVIPNWKWHVNVKPVGKMAIRLRQQRMFWLRHPLVFEGFMLGALQRLVRKGDVVYDIGANVGLYSRFFVQAFHASSVYAFEPIASNRTLLAENLKIGGCTEQVTIVPCAVGNEDGFCDFQIDDLTANSGTLDAVTHGKASQSRAQYGLPPATVSVEVVRLDSFVANKGFPKPDVIKLDVEGAEALALEGARSILLQHSPHLVIELHGTQAARDVLQVLWSVGYHCFAYLSQGGTTAYQEITPDDLVRVAEKYSVHFLAASRDASVLLQPIEDYAVSN